MKSDYAYLTVGLSFDFSIDYNGEDKPSVDLTCQQ